MARPLEFDLDHDAVRVAAGLPYIEQSTLTRAEARLRAAYDERISVTLTAAEVEALLATLDTLRSLSSNRAPTELVVDDSEEP